LGNAANATRPTEDISPNAKFGSRHGATPSSHCGMAGGAADAQWNRWLFGYVAAGPIWTG